MVDVVLLGIRTDYQAWYTEAEAILIDEGRRDMVVISSQSSHEIKIAVVFQSGPFMTALTSPVT